MLSLEKLKADLAVTSKDVSGRSTKAVSGRPTLEIIHLIHPNISVSVSSKYAFKCVCCEGIGFPPWYELTKKTVGFYGRETDVSKIRSTKGIVSLRELGFVPEFDSHLNHTKDGIVCDHCYDSVYAKPL